ncbi:MAG: GH92 family glycosyl hydrolase [Proteiniphilum sp.]|jgi:predicted alpha-1,2-mannosidase|nr:GH92 family glycosyl hydrolase [Proteiniphilum sp.]
MSNECISAILLAALLAALQGCDGRGEPKTVWQTGIRDGRASEFALSSGDFKEFLNRDFGWEDRFYLIGKSKPEEDFPCVLPGPDDAWGGTSHTAGIRTHVLNILFGMKTAPRRGEWKLIIDILDTHRERRPFLKVTVNGQSSTHILPTGGGDESLTGNYARCMPHTLEIPLDAGLIRKGGNEINLTILEGSWLLFDAIRLDGPRHAILRKETGATFVRNVEAADYLLAETRSQPLLVDMEHLTGTPLAEVSVDGKIILRQHLEQGRYQLEAPMPAVSSPRKSSYTISIDGKPVEKGKIIRSPQKEITAADYVDTRMGTAHSRWMIAPGPWMPFSMVKLSPDNQNAGWQAGYDPSFESIGTFSHIHEWTMAGLGTLPVNGPLKTKPGDQSIFGKEADAYRSRIDKRSEEAKIGYYKVTLTDYDITAELTSTTRCSFQRYRYPPRSDSRIMIDLKIPAEYKFDIPEARITRTGPRRIEGYSKQQSRNVWSTDAGQDYTLHFVMEFDRDITHFGGWINNETVLEKEIHAENPEHIGCFVEFDTRQNPTVQLRTGISFVDLKGAAKNLEEEITTPFGWNFDAIRHSHRRAWNDILTRIHIRSNDRREKKRFYTALYRSYSRNTLSDTDGRWRDADEEVRQFDDPDALALSCDAFWNTFWNLNQLWNLITPEWTSRWVKSQLAMYDAGGWLAKGPAGMEYIPVMVAEHEIPLLVSAWQMGIRDFDAEKVFAAALKMQTTPPRHTGNGFAGNRDLSSYLEYGYVPADRGRFSNTLEYAYDDWTLSQLAKSLGKEKEYKIFSERGTRWQHVIDPETGFARMRYGDGTWEKEFDPFKSGANHHYVEGNAWQLTFFVPQDVPALIAKIGREEFINRLTWGFEASEPLRYNAPGDRYWDYPVVQGNQQSMHFAYLFNWAGQPWQTQKWSRSIVDRYYGYEVSNACPGDEDQGQMSAWFIMSALGLFQTDGGCRTEPVYEIGSPLFERTVINLGEKFGRGKQFEIIAENVSRRNKYVQTATLNGKPLNTFHFPAKELLNGGTLTLQMGPEPRKEWGIIADR